MKLNLLIATDNAVYAEEISGQLRAAGLDCSVRTASGPAEFQAPGGGSVPDLIILDYGLKSWNGEEALKAAGAAFPSIPCVVISDEAPETGAAPRGAAAFVPKEKIDRIAQAVSEALRQRGPSAVPPQGLLPGITYSCPADGETALP